MRQFILMFADPFQFRGWVRRWAESTAGGAPGMVGVSIEKRRAGTTRLRELPLRGVRG